MARVRARDTKPEMIVRRLLTERGLRYRLHRRDLPGTPDVAFMGRRKAIFVHGCFWHGHDCARGARTPKTNADYWLTKIATNRARDARNATALTAMGWSVATVWECETRELGPLRERLWRFVTTTRGPGSDDPGRATENNEGTPTPPR